MKLFKAAALVLGLLPFAAMVTPANAETQTFDWTLSGPAASLGGFPVDESGTLTATLLSGDTWSVDSLTVGGVAATLANTDGADNLLYTKAGFDALDTSGLAFTTPG